jgi:hypothetical protein
MLFSNVFILGNLAFGVSELINHHRYFDSQTEETEEAEHFI